jgi:hypothetical protein
MSSLFAAIVKLARNIRHILNANISELGFVAWEESWLGIHPNPNMIKYICFPNCVYNAYVDIIVIQSDLIINHLNPV